VCGQTTPQVYFFFFAWDRSEAMGARSFFGVLGSRRSLPACEAVFLEVIFHCTPQTFSCVPVSSLLRLIKDVIIRKINELREPTAFYFSRHPSAYTLKPAHESWIITEADRFSACCRMIDLVTYTFGVNVANTNLPPSCLILCQRTKIARTLRRAIVIVIDTILHA